MKYFEEVIQTDTRPCAGLREDLKRCLMESECVTKLRKTPKECLQTNDPSVPEECFALRYSFFDCKRSFSWIKARSYLQHDPDKNVHFQRLCEFKTTLTVVTSIECLMPGIDFEVEEATSLIISLLIYYLLNFSLFGK